VSGSPQLLRAAPYFPVPDVEQAVVHYEGVFGFAREYVAGTPAEFAMVSRDGHCIMLRRVSGDISPNERQGGTWDAFFWVRDVHELHDELTGRGAVVVYGPIVQQAYNMEEFAVRDRDGYVLGFGQALS
jgi:hypothetical protein